MFALLLYRLLLLILLPFLLLALVIRSKNNPAYRARLTERFGLFPKPFKQGGIIVHAASVGEVIALKSFIEQLLDTYPELPITVTTFTPTGSAQVNKLFGNKVQHGYLPLDVFFASKLFLHRLKPKMMIFMETELWPNLISQCADNKVKLLLVNGRLSAKSLKSYKKLTPLITPCIQRFDHILCQSQENLEHYLQLGAKPQSISNSGNLKFDISLNNDIQAKQTELANLLKPAKQNQRPIWLIASTHEGDEALALASYQKVIAEQADLLLVIVPRHPERFDAVAKLCLAQGLSLARRSENSVVNNEQVWLLDSLGELMAACSHADIITMGGSFSQIGGHNPLEPALFKKPIIVGSDMSNFKEITQQLLESSALIQLNTESHQTSEQSEELSKTLSALLNDKHKQTVLGESAYQVVLTNQGASQRSIEKVQELMQ
ncbi:lipid IV(A) 3-deoxy-D-manno-octulosonic acid transferase [Litorilituus sediminis]|uniref:3-deoxy-D-manno-octulosonic acid transferase n=1 Tax=Litorilituus sediminis TaxID=718192 RepID=A0A4P6P495_9GAMM|nr:lipid IV(A) 3-deoxy-D-manno-octulosonic acid transferase [Litorilituus sediminis]QBG36164.1 3-deoxy-D-manno-octulosonic acid transferase [Litorilituus sediminis]